ASDKRWKLQAADITQLARLGRAMLAWSAQLVAPGGTLLYATCTITKEENQATIDDFLNTAAGKDFVVEPVQQSELAPVFMDALCPRGFFQTLPVSKGPDGHFAARLRRFEGS
ncbi:MAG: hypothetical protein FWF11_05295, partial [Coriobacteriia bacterium]|nr:hypothetical protein [Coriobacteriia bacterium]